MKGKTILVYDLSEPIILKKISKIGKLMEIKSDDWVGFTFDSFFNIRLLDSHYNYNGETTLFNELSNIALKGGIYNGELMDMESSLSKIIAIVNECCFEYNRIIILSNYSSYKKILPFPKGYGYLISIEKTKYEFNSPWRHLIYNRNIISNIKKFEQRGTVNNDISIS